MPHSTHHFPSRYSEFKSYKETKSNQCCKSPPVRIRPDESAAPDNVITLPPVGEEEHCILNSRSPLSLVHPTCTPPPIFNSLGCSKSWHPVCKQLNIFVTMSSKAVYDTFQPGVMSSPFRAYTSLFCACDQNIKTLENTFPAELALENFFGVLSSNCKNYTASNNLEVHRFVLPANATIINWEKWCSIAHQTCTNITDGKGQCVYVSRIRWNNDHWITL